MDTAPRQPGRRAVLAAFGFGAVGLAGAGWIVADQPSEPAWRRRRITVTQWRASSNGWCAVGHRGSGDVRPEHTVAAYDAALGWGAQALEISTSSTSDGVLICMHDLSYDRTTNARGLIHDQPSSVLSRIGVRQPQLGPAWLRPPLAKVPRLEEVLRRYGGHAVLCLEAKRDADYPAMIAMVEQYRLQDSVIVKAYRGSGSIALAQQAGYPVFAYLDSADTNRADIAYLVSVLNPDRDYLGLPTTSSDDQSLLDPTLVHNAVASGVPVWVYPVHRRSEAAYFSALGVRGMMASSYRYLTTTAATATRDRWRTGAIESGEITRSPASATFAPQWASDGTLSLATSSAQHFLTVGQLAPVPHARRTYQVELDARWNAIPADQQTHLGLAFGHDDDTYYQDGYAASSGYEAVVRADGSLQLRSHQAGSSHAATLAATSTPPPAVGQWMRLRLHVSPSHITWSRSDTGSAASVTVADARFRGGYLHIGRSNTDTDASASFRNLAIR